MLATYVKLTAMFWLLLQLEVYELRGLQRQVMLAHVRIDLMCSQLLYTSFQWLLMWLGLRQSFRSPCRWQLIPAFMTAVLSGTDGKVWLHEPCDTSVTEFSVSTLGVPAHTDGQDHSTGSNGWGLHKGLCHYITSFERFRGLFICSALLASSRRSSSG